jgi:uncharacterized membrane protein
MVQNAAKNANHGNTSQKTNSTAWTNFSAAICGLWLATNSSIPDRAASALIINDLVCGLAICVLSLIALGRGKDWLRWLVACIGAWLLFSPLIFWAPTPFRYDSSTLIGSLVIAFSFLIPGQPGAKHTPGPDIPPGWSYNPSSWQQRGPLIAIALIGFFLARYLAAYQLGYISHPWDPFFGNGTQKVLSSDISKAFVISDAGLGAVSYLIDVLEGFLGRSNRWRTMPWAVIIFAASIVPAGVTSIVLVMLQPIGVGAWCTICLVAAVAMLIMVPYAFDELVATCQFLVRSYKRGDSLWRTLLFGGSDEETVETDKPQPGLQGGFVGVNFPITLVLSAVVGAWVMFSPALLSLTQQASDSQHLVGALIATIAIAAMAEPCRAARFLNVMCGAWLILSLFLLPGFVPIAAWANMITGIVVIALSVPRGKISERYGSFDKFVF